MSCKRDLLGGRLWRSDAACCCRPPTAAVWNNSLPAKADSCQCWRVYKKRPLQNAVKRYQCGCYHAFWPAFRPRKPAVILLITDQVCVQKLSLMVEDQSSLKFLDMSNPAGNWSSSPAE